MWRNVGQPFSTLSSWSSQSALLVKSLVTRRTVHVPPERASTWISVAIGGPPGIHSLSSATKRRGGSQTVRASVRRRCVVVAGHEPGDGGGQLLRERRPLGRGPEVDLRVEGEGMRLEGPQVVVDLLPCQPDARGERDPTVWVRAATPACLVQGSPEGRWNCMPGSPLLE
jgi:hypothetical protein